MNTSNIDKNNELQKQNTNSSNHNNITVNTNLINNENNNNENNENNNNNNNNENNNNDNDNNDIFRSNKKRLADLESYELLRNSPKSPYLAKQSKKT
ncbi:unnamed protein product [[Candida] boidinii]|nr:unnamed protein product [[Candida] boidinii]